MLTPRRAGLGLIAAVLVAAGILSQANVRLAGSQAITINSQGTRETVSLDDPLAGVWNSTAPVEIPLSVQNVSPPMGGGSIRTINVRSLHDDKLIYFRLEWDDATQDVASFAPQQFRDAAAIQFPASGVSTLPSFCMGQAGAQVNIWQWKSDWQAQMDSGFVDVQQAYPNSSNDGYPFQDEKSFYPGRAAGNLLSQTRRLTPVENLVAGGFGTLTTANEQAVQGKGVWRDGKWYVLFYREMKTDSDTYTPFTLGQTTNVAFAAWDGNQGERNGMKSVSQFADLKVDPSVGLAADRSVDAGGFVALGLLAAAALTVIVGGFVFISKRLNV